jgi:hypothetical protein
VDGHLSCKIRVLCDETSSLHIHRYQCVAANCCPDLRPYTYKQHVTPHSVTALEDRNFNTQGFEILKFQLKTGHEGPQEYRYSSTLSLTSALDGVGGQHHARPLYLRKDPVAPGPVWPGTENLASTGIRSLDRPAHSESLYRPSYPGQRVNLKLIQNFNEKIFSNLNKDMH